MRRASSDANWIVIDRPTISGCCDGRRFPGDASIQSTLDSARHTSTGGGRRAGGASGPGRCRPRRAGTARQRWTAAVAGSCLDPRDHQAGGELGLREAALSLPQRLVPVDHQHADDSGPNDHGAAISGRDRFKTCSTAPGVSCSLGSPRPSDLFMARPFFLGVPDELDLA